MMDNNSITAIHKPLLPLRTVFCRSTCTKADTISASWTMANGMRKGNRLIIVSVIIGSIVTLFPLIIYRRWKRFLRPHVTASVDWMDGRINLFHRLYRYILERMYSTCQSKKRSAMGGAPPRFVDNIGHKQTAGKNVSMKTVYITVVWNSRKPWKSHEFVTYIA